MIFFYSSKVEVSGSKLLFKDTTLDEAGIYQCSAENVHGMIVSSTYVKVLGEFGIDNFRILTAGLDLA